MQSPAPAESAATHDNVNRVPMERQFSFASLRSNRRKIPCTSSQLLVVTKTICRTFSKGRFDPTESEIVSEKPIEKVRAKKNSATTILSDDFVEVIVFISVRCAILQMFKSKNNSKSISGELRVDKTNSDLLHAMCYFRKNQRNEIFIIFSRRRRGQIASVIFET